MAITTVPVVQQTGALRAAAARQAARRAATRLGQALLILLGALAGLAWLAAMAYILIELVAWWVSLPAPTSLPVARSWMR